MTNCIGLSIIVGQLFNNSCMYCIIYGMSPPLRVRHVFGADATRRIKQCYIIGITLAMLIIITHYEDLC